MSAPDRRKFPRLEVPVFYRAVISTSADRRQAVNLSQCGVRLYSDQSFAKTGSADWTTGKPPLESELRTELGTDTSRAGARPPSP